MGKRALIWTKVLADGKRPSARGGHSCICIGEKLLIFGGHYYAGAGQFEFLNDTLLFDLETNTWSNLPCLGEPPSPRYGHSATFLDGKMFVYGGRSPSGVDQKDIFVLDLFTCVWSTLRSVTPPPPNRFSHACALVGRKLVVHGGWNGRRSLADTWVFDLESSQWTELKPDGIAPTPRYGHNLVYIEDGRLLLHGGYSVAKGHLPVYEEDTRILDLSKMVWQRPTFHGRSPVGRFGHTASPISENCLLFIGGWSGRKDATLAQGRSHKSGDLSEATDLPDDRNYIHALSVKDFTWSSPESVSEKVVLNRYGHSATVFKNKVYIFGGWDGQRALGDLWLLDAQDLL